MWAVLTAVLCCAVLCCACCAGNNAPAGAEGGKGEAIAMTSPVRMEIQDEKKKGEAIAMT
jgi:hypothetical protein